MNTIRNGGVRRFPWISARWVRRAWRSTRDANGTLGVGGWAGSTIERRYHKRAGRGGRRAGLRCRRKAMRLGVNAVRLTRPFTGIGRYLECVLDEWSRMDLPFERVTLYSPVPLDPGRVLFPLERFETVVGGPKAPDPYWEARFLTPRAAQMDVLFAPSYTLPWRYPGAAVVTNQGPAQNRPLTYQWWRAHAYEQLYRYSARHAQRVVTCSQAVKRRMVELYGVPASKVTVVWNAASRLFAPVRDAA